MYTVSLKDEVRGYIDPLLLILRESLYGSGVSFGRIYEGALPTTTIYTTNIEQVATEKGFIKGISVYSGESLVAPTATRLKFKGSSVTLSGQYVVITDPVPPTIITLDHNHTASGDGGYLTNDVHDGYSVYEVIAAPSTPSAGSIRLYAKDKVGTAELFYKNSAGVERDLSLLASGSSGGGSTTYTSTVGNEPTTGLATGDLYLESNGLALERYTTSGWGRWGPIYKLTPPPTSGWTWVNQGTAAVDTTYGGIYISQAAVAADLQHLYVRPVPSGAYTITAMLLINLPYGLFTGAGLTFRESSSGKIHTFGVRWLSTTQFVIAGFKWTNATTFSASYFEQSHQQSIIWFRIADDGSNRICSVSSDGQHWIARHTIGRTDFLTADQVGIFINSNSANVPIGMNLLSWEQT